MRKIIVLVAAMALALGFASAAQAATKFTVTTKLDHSTIDLGEKQRVTGKVSPSSPGKTVKIYVHYANDLSGTYHYVGKKTLGSRSTFSQSFTPEESGTTRIKVVKAASGSRKAGSSSKSFRNFGLLRLSDLERTIEDGDMVNDDTFSIGGLSSVDGYRFEDGNGRARLALHGQCRTFTGTGGVPDDDNSLGGEASANFLARKSATGDVLQKHEGPFQYQGGPVDEISLKLYQKIGSKNVYARYLTIATQEQGGVHPRYGLIDTTLVCNLPGTDY